LLYISREKVGSLILFAFSLSKLYYYDTFDLFSHVFRLRSGNQLRVLIGIETRTKAGKQAWRVHGIARERNMQGAGIGR